MLEYIKRVREKQNCLYEEINYTTQLRRGREQLKERLIWINKTIKQLELKDSLEYDLDMELFIDEKDRIINEIDNLEFNIRYSTIRINYYKEICSITTTLG